MARINVDQKALVDARYDLLGSLLGASRHDALGRMIVLWNQCLERGSYFLPVALVDAVMMGKGGVVVAADLAEDAGDGTLRIKGTEGRIEWLHSARQNGREGGAAGAEHGKKGGRPPGNPQKTPRRGLNKPPDGGFKNPRKTPFLSPSSFLLPPKDKEQESFVRPGARAAALVLDYWHAIGNKFTPSQEAELRGSLADLDRADDDLEQAVHAVFRQKDPPRTPWKVSQEIREGLIAMEAGETEFAHEPA